MISKLLNESLTVRLMYEINQKTLNQKVTKDDELVKYILNTDNFDMNHVLSLLDELEIDKINQGWRFMWFIMKDLIQRMSCA